MAEVPSRSSQASFFLPGLIFLAGVAALSRKRRSIPLACLLLLSFTLPFLGVACGGGGGGGGGGGAPPGTPTPTETEVQFRIASSSDVTINGDATGLSGPAIGLPTTAPALKL